MLALLLLCVGSLFLLPAVQLSVDCLNIAHCLGHLCLQLLRLALGDSLLQLFFLPVAFLLCVFIKQLLYLLCALLLLRGKPKGLGRKYAVDCFPTLLPIHMLQLP